MIVGSSGHSPVHDSPGPMGDGPVWQVIRGPICTSRCPQQTQAQLGSIPAKRAATTKLYGCIHVVGWQQFVDQTVDALKVLMKTATGAAIAADISACGKTVWITKITKRTVTRGKGRWYASAWEHDKDGARSQDPRPHAADPDSIKPGQEPSFRPGHPATWVPKNPGNGSNTTIEWDPMKAHIVTPGALIIGHELIHARRNARGYQLVGNWPFDENIEIEEAALSGPHHPTLPMTGNQLRKDLSALPGAYHLSPRRYFL